VIRAYEEQCAAVEKLGGRIILMASRALVKAARSPDDYAKVYCRILGQVKEPVIIHWLGEMFDPALAATGAHRPHGRPMSGRVDVIAANPAKVDGVKISLLDKDKEIAMRRRLPQGVRMYTGDDFNYAELIAGDEQGLFRRAARHLRRSSRRPQPPRSARSAAATRDVPRDPLRRPFRCRATSSRRRPASTRTGVVFMAYLNGLQNHFHHGSAARRARARRCISARAVSSLPMPAGLLADLGSLASNA
jgi:hypothetical protein